MLKAEWFIVFMKIRLYTNTYEDAQEEDLRYLDIEVDNKHVKYCLTPQTKEEISEGLYEFSNRFFSYKKDTRYKNIFPDLKLNYYISIDKSSLEYKTDYYSDESTIGGKEGYCYLNQYQAFELNWAFGKTWFQQSENIKWLISIPLSILTAWITTLLTK